MSWVAAAIGGGALLGAGGSVIAGNQQAKGQKRAARTQQNMFDTVVGQEQPFLQAGYGATTRLLELLGLGGTPGGVTGSPLSFEDWSAQHPGTKLPIQFGGGTFGGGTRDGYDAYLRDFQHGSGPNSDASDYGSLMQPFNPTMEQLEQYPGYQFAKQQGETALRNSLTPTVGALSGPALKSLINFNQGLATQTYNNAFSNYQTQQTNLFNRLSGLIGLGQNAAGNLGNAGAALGTGVAQAQAGAGASTAAGISGAAGNLGQSLSTLGLMNWVKP